MTPEQAAELITLTNDIKEILTYVLGSIVFTAGMLPVTIFFIGKKAK